eukprot:Hpha_TRINITY_DN1589_c0_g1::TRINITY_DN1589_c0_g1_i1::g.57195::m.57195
MCDMEGSLSPLSISPARLRDSVTPPKTSPARSGVTNGVEPPSEAQLGLQTRSDTFLLVDLGDDGSSSSSGLPPPPPGGVLHVSQASRQRSNPRQRPRRSVASSISRPRESVTGATVAVAAECALLRGRLAEARRALEREQARRFHDRERIRELSVENAVAVEQIARLRLALAGRPAPDAEACLSSLLTLHQGARSPTLRRAPRRAAPKPEKAGAVSPSRLPLFDFLEEAPAGVATSVKRTLGPPPAARRDAVSVDAAVELLRESFAGRGLELPLTRVGDLAYELSRGGKRVKVLNLLLTQDGRLLVHAGGGARPLLEVLGAAPPQLGPDSGRADAIAEDTALSFGKLARRCTEGVPRGL